MALILSIRHIGSIIGALPLGNLADRIGQKPNVILARETVTVCIWASSFDQTLRCIMVTNRLAGVGLAGTPAPARSLATEFATFHNRGAVVSIVGPAYALGTAFGAFGGGYLVTQFVWKTVFVTGGRFPLPSSSQAFPFGCILAMQRTGLRDENTPIDR